MKWWTVIAVWFGFLFLSLFVFHAMITMRDIEVIIIGDDEDEEKGE